MEREEDEEFEPSGPEEREVASELAEERSEFVGLMQHFYRGELGRATAWRARLDRTTNWAVGVVATLITWAFSAAGNPHYIILGSLGIVTVFLVVEARRYRIYDIWRSRVRLVEENIFANAADPEGVVHERWRELLATDLRNPRVKVPLFEALSRRLKRVYLPLMTIIILSWTVRITVFAADGVGVVDAASIDVLSGAIVIGVVCLFYIVMIGIAFWPTDRRAKGKKREFSERTERWRK
ncbi:DUF2270 domain-containing protein [Halopenitus sp. H-Gu1]|uniref:DUF2270 domain-containing protein n=1 Tax=Halopenitus sp. H-Gu1 TaxID=3242697 RepID=UPI00359D95E1